MESSIKETDRKTKGSDMESESDIKHLKKEKRNHVFKKFKDSEGNFEKALTTHVPAMLSFYEATHLRVHGEDILEQALVFTSSHLKSMMPSLSDFFREQVMLALNQPICMSLPRVDARRIISIYQKYDTRDKVVLKFAKLDFNLLQKEYSGSTFVKDWFKDYVSGFRWWRDLEFLTKYPFARDRLVESYFWSLSVYFEPKFAMARRMLAKIIALATIIDEIYDVYGSYDELRCFTHVIESSDSGRSAIDQLSSYMRLCYLAILDVYSEMEEELAKKGKTYRLYYAKNEMKKLIRAYFDEAKWYHSDYSVPTFEEYIKVSLVSSGYMMVATISLVGIEDNLMNKYIMDWVTKEPLVVKASTVIARLMDDIAGHEFEQEKGHEPSTVECLMTQNGTSKEEVILELQKLVNDAWEDVNKQCLSPTDVLVLILVRVLNLVRVIDLLYKDGDTKDQVLGVSKQFQTSVERETGKKLKSIRTNNSGEYSGPFDKYCKHQAKLLNSFWGEAFLIVAHVINLSLIVYLQSDVPNRVWYGNDVFYDHLRVFGCKAFVHVSKDERSKLDAKTRHCICVKYGLDEFGYKIYDPIEKKLARSCDIVLWRIKLLKILTKRRS
ncbi:(-)-germacrene D synthase-like [Solanum verrucosum]|uniref:(-)-germacrene D synthase-like n=1 Tax=Solanum verrucosum TaxID=315347 RepID=UPI0020D1C249|nr:(-)-germacrene D synthase-like [Solanum verrucosum]